VQGIRHAQDTDVGFCYELRVIVSVFLKGMSLKEDAGK